MHNNSVGKDRAGRVVDAGAKFSLKLHPMNAPRRLGLPEGRSLKCSGLLRCGFASREADAGILPNVSGRPCCLCHKVGFVQCTAVGSQNSGSLPSRIPHLQCLLHVDTSRPAIVVLITIGLFEQKNWNAAGIEMAGGSAQQDKRSPGLRGREKSWRLSRGLHSACHCTARQAYRI
jgi:hypothetical protein